VTIVLSVSTIALRCGGYWTDSDLAGALDIFDDPQALLEHWRQDTQADTRSKSGGHRASA